MPLSSVPLSGFHKSSSVPLSGFPLSGFARVTFNSACGSACIGEIQHHPCRIATTGNQTNATPEVILDTLPPKNHATDREDDHGQCRQIAEERRRVDFQRTRT